MAPGAGAADFEHQSVMLGEIVAAFEPVPPGVVVDATVGGGGHSEAILDARPDVSVLGLDRDPAPWCRERAAGQVREPVLHLPLSVRRPRRPR